MLANEPSVALYRLQEHVRRSLPELVQHKVIYITQCIRKVNTNCGKRFTFSQKIVLTAVPCFFVCFVLFVCIFVVVFYGWDVEIQEDCVFQP